MKGLFASRAVQGCLALALVSTAAMAQHNRYFERVWFQLEQAENPASAQRLPGYYVDIEGRAIGDETNVSALSYDPERKTLVSVTNQRPHFLELSLEGKRAPITPCVIKPSANYAAATDQSHTPAA